MQDFILPLNDSVHCIKYTFKDVHVLVIVGPSALVLVNQLAIPPTGYNCIAVPENMF